ncbi:MAG: hypothetical protein JSS65_11195 [Armatimonadetes bacterium]|nr:hypothetical protein [Armatimonadota bacterium]
MDEIRRRDEEVFRRQFLSPGRVVVMALMVCLAALTLTAHNPVAGFMGIITGAAVIGAIASAASREAKEKRFHSQRLRQQWALCEERVKRFHDAAGALRKRGLVDFQELPVTVEKLSKEIYIALRKADLIQEEVVQSEGSLRVPNVQMPTGMPDAQSQELYRLADRNIAEYQQHWKSVVSGIQRTEAQSVVFVTTLDALRIRMLNYRLAGRSPEVENREFLGVITEAKMQFAAIDKALDELEMTPYPQTVTFLPPIPTAVVEEHPEGRQ